MQHGWAAAFGTLALAMGASNALFFVGTPLYRHRLPGGSPLTRVAQVLVAAFRKRNAAFDSGDFVGLYEVAGAKPSVAAPRSTTPTTSGTYVSSVGCAAHANERTNGQDSATSIQVSDSE